MLRPGRVAWFGGGGTAPAIEYMRASGYSGEAVVVNPGGKAVAGLPAYASVDALPWTPDLAILVIPKEAVVDTTRALAARGCGGAICITSGFSESEGGAARQQALVDAAGDMPVIGPNCPGIANFLDGNAFMMDHFGNHVPRRGAAVISNGGAYLSDLGCADRSQPIAYLVGLGNQATVDMGDMLDVILDDARVTAVNLYFEGIGNAARLGRAAARAARLGIPVVAVKGGRSAAGQRAARSHTASLAGDAEIASALFRRFGWIEAKTPSEAIETIKMLSFTALPRGMKTGFITSSGSYAVLGGDVAEQAGLQMTPPDPATVPALDAALPGYVGAANPLDISDAHGWPLNEQLPIYRAFAQTGYDLFVQVMCYPPEGGWDMSTWDVTTEALAEARGERPAAFVNTLAEALPRTARERLAGLGLAPLQGLEDGLRAVAHAARYGAALARLDADAMPLAEEAPCDGATSAPVDEATAKQRLDEYGLDLPRRRVVDDGGALPDRPGRYVLKALVPGLLHKTEAGAVMLDLDAGDLRDALHAMRARLHDDGHRPDGYLVEEMIENTIAELLVGIRRVPGIGRVLTLASGGVAAELLRDTATLILPASRAAIERSLRELQLAPLLLGYRGRPAADLERLLDAIERLCAAVGDDPEIAEIEINPLLLTPTRAVVADALLTLYASE